MEGFTLAIECLSLGVAHGTAFPRSLAVTSPMKPSSHKEARKGNSFICLEVENQK